jgi:Ca-activated chloride channel family protein
VYGPGLVKRQRWALQGLVLVAVAASAAVAAADPPVRQPGLHADRPLPMVRSEYEARAIGPLFEVVVRQTFRNPGDRAVEATYIYPLPTDAAVSALSIKTGDRTITGAIQPRAAAHAAYEAAVSAGAVAAIVDRDRADVFAQSVTGIAPGATVSIELRWDTMARRVGDQWELRLPMVLAPRQVPGVETGAPVVGLGSHADTDRAPDASKVTPVVAAGAGDVAASVVLHLDGATDLSSPTDEARVTPRAGGLDATIDVAEIDHDVVVRYRAAAPRAGWLDEVDGVIATMIERPVPTTRAAARVVVAVDPAVGATVVGGVQAGRLVAGLARALGTSDQLAVLAGATSMPWRAGGAALDAKTMTALQRPTAIELGRLLTAAKVACEAGKGAACAVILVSDGLVANDDEIRAAARAVGAPVLPVSVGPAPNHGLLEAIAGDTGGVARAVTASDDPRALLPGLMADAAVAPAAPTVSFPGAEVVARVPEAGALLGAGQSMLVMARLRPGKRPGKVSVDGSLFGLLVPRAAPPAAAPIVTGGLLARRFAAMELAGLEHSGAAADEIERVALRGGLVSSATSLVAVGADVVVEGGVRSTVAVAVAPPAGMAVGGVDELELDSTLARSAGVAMPPPPPPSPTPDVAKSEDGERTRGRDLADDLGDDLADKAPIDDAAPSGGAGAGAADVATLDREAGDRRYDLDDDDPREQPGAAIRADVGVAEQAPGRAGRRVHYLSLTVGALVASSTDPMAALALRTTTRRGWARLGAGLTGWFVAERDDAAPPDEAGRQLGLVLRPALDVSVRRPGGWFELGVSLGVHLASDPGLAYAVVLRGPRYGLGRSWLTLVARWDGVVRGVADPTDQAARHDGALTFGYELAR